MNGDLHILLAKVFRSHRRRSHSCLSKVGITQGQPRILDYLWEHDGCIQRDIAENCHLEPATVTSIISNMEKSEMVERRPDPNDRRVFCVWLTEKGKETRTTMREIFGKLEKECFEGFSEDEIEDMSNYLKRMLQNLRRAEENNQ